MSDQPKESDWRAFREMIPELRERFLRAKNEELASILDDASLSPTERFWEVEEKVREIGKTLRACLDGHSRSKMTLFMMTMFNHGMMTEEDLVAFSPELRERMQLLRKSL